MTIRQVFAVLLFVQLFNMGVRETLDPDMWWHLRTGEFISRHGIPQHDLFSFTVPDHAWVTHEWLSEALMWVIFQRGGLEGLSLAFAALAAFAFWLVYRCSEGQPYLAGLLVVLASFTAAPSFGVRPQIFNLVMTGAFVSVIERVRNGRLNQWALCCLPLLTIVWVNLHSGYLLGVVLVATYAAGDGLEDLLRTRAQRRLVRSDVRRLAAVAVACGAAALLNPNGWSLWSYPFGTLGSAAMQENIAEWRSPDFHLRLYWPFAAMLGAGTVGWLVSRKRPRGADVLLFLGTALAGLVSVRHIAVFAVVATPLLARSWAGILSETKAYPLLTGQRRSGPLSDRAARLNWVILLAGVLAAGVWDAGRLRKNDAAVARTYPAKAVDFLQRHGLATERGYNTYAWGGYLIWRGLPVFVDGRADVYGDDFLSYYLKTFRLMEDWHQPLDDFDVAYVLLERSNPLSTLLAASAQWREAYADDVARIFVRAEVNRFDRGYLSAAATCPQ